MSSDSFKKLIKHYANGSEICNCGEAYYTNCGKGSVGGQDRDDLPTCKHGCSSNIITAKNYIAEMVLSEFDPLQEQQ